MRYLRTYMHSTTDCQADGNAPPDAIVPTDCEGECSIEGKFTPSVAPPPLPIQASLTFNRLMGTFTEPRNSFESCRQSKLPLTRMVGYAPTALKSLVEKHYDAWYVLSH